MYVTESAWGLLPYCSYYTNLMEGILRDLLSFHDSLVLADIPAKGNDVRETTLHKYGGKLENGASKASAGIVFLLKLIIQ